MCGICGIYNACSERPVAAILLEQMMKMLEHRGPDDRGIYLENEIGLGFRRLSIIDLTSGNQPISNETGDIWLVFNGEIWNYRVLREELKSQGHIFRTQGDAEVIIHAYEEYGTDCIARLHGMFGLAIWDSKQKQLLLARDRTGKKPLYYANVEGDLIFGSEIKALFNDPRLIRQPDLQSLVDFLSVRYVPGPATMFKDIYKVQPGHWLLYRQGIMHEECYWDFSFEPLEQRQPYSTATYIQEIRKHVYRAVEERMISDVPVGAFLSGGVDSSIIVGTMSQLSSQPVQTFSVGFNAEGFSELPYARQVANHFGTENHELMLTSAELIKYWPLLTWYRDEPVSEDADVAVYMLSRLANSYVKVVLSGEGGDELFAGYPKYLFDGLARYYHLLPSAIRHNFVTPLLGLLPYRMRKITIAGRSIADPAPQRWVNWFGIFNGSWKAQLLAPAVQAQVDMHAGRLFQRLLDLHPQRDDLSRMLYLDTKTWLPDNLLIRNDRMTMAASIEGRMPFLDEHLIAYAASIPSHLKVRGWQTKYLLKQAFADLLPASILTRKKMGFNMPTGEWFQKDQRVFMTNLLLSDRARSRGLFNHVFIEHLLREHLEGRTNYEAQLFHLASLEIWFRVFIDPTHLSLPDMILAELEQAHLTSVK